MATSTDQQSSGRRHRSVSSVIACCGIALLAAGVVAIELRAATAVERRATVYFLRGEQLAPATRTSATPLDTVRQLIAGPTKSERMRGFRTYLPTATRILSMHVAKDVATVNLNERFDSGGVAESLLARLSQLVRTVTTATGAGKVQLLMNGKTVAARFPGISTSRPITFRFLQTPNLATRQPVRRKLPPRDGGVMAVQRRLITLGYLLRGDDDGRFGPATQNAILAFQKWERLARTGLVNTQTHARLVLATRPSPRSLGGPGKRAEILLDRQVALLIHGNKVVRAIAVSSGKASTPTPPGNYRVYAKIPRWWSVPFREWLPWALPFVGGIAFHELQEVPAYPASHGCVRESSTVARWTYDFATVGMPVKVLARS
jgi:hypothetical protein